MSCSGSSHTGLADLIHKQFRENVVFTPLKTNVVGVLWGQNVGGESLGTLQQQRVSKPLQKHSQTGTKFEISEIGVLSHILSTAAGRMLAGRHEKYPSAEILTKIGRFREKLQHFGNMRIFTNVGGYGRPAPLFRLKEAQETRF